MKHVLHYYDFILFTLFIVILQFYLYEIDENSEDFHAKQPRQVLPYAVLTFSIVKPEGLQARPPNEKPEV